ncbi:MAG: FIST C-terminal domain-containing protein [Spirochaetes bacterium]|nr:FIST C-terminal domain-containing protein [Spirochaetota bacterium]
MRIKAGLGASGLKDAYDAGKEAAGAAVAELNGEKPALVLVFTMPHYDMNRLLSGVRLVTGSTPLAGSTTAGEIIRGRYMGFGAGVTVTVLTAGDYRFGIASASHIRGDLNSAGQEIARNSKAEAGPSPYSAMILMADCLAGDLQQLFYGAYKIAGPGTAIVGGAASDEMQFKETFVFHNDKSVEQGGVAVWIASEKPLNAVTRHGWNPVGVPLLVTRAEGTEIMELGGRPAAIAYEEQIGISPGQLTPENFWDTSMYYPFGIMQMDGSNIIRVARNKKPNGSLLIQACVPPPGSAVQVMEGSADSILSVVEEVGHEAIAGNPDTGVILAFSCAMRPKIMKDRTPEEAERLQAAAGNAAVCGMYCCGEFARTVGTLGTHNATLTVLAL